MSSEIDDIFASKGRPNSVQPIASSSALPAKKSKKSNKSKPIADDASKPPKNTSTKKRPAPETVVDPSMSIPAAKRSKIAVAPGESRSKSSGFARNDGGHEAEERFKDSRGSGPRQKTAEGFLIYKEDELRIGNDGGDTPLCPFDCQCCF